MAAGIALWLSFPEHNLWWAAPVGVALLGLVTWGRGLRSGFGLGMVAGWAFFVPVLSWSGTYVGALPWLALATLQALYVAVMSALVAWGSARLLARSPSRQSKVDEESHHSAGGDSSSTFDCLGRRAAAYGLVPLGWVAQELARSTTPWGGFPWARLAFSQADSPLVRYAAWGGAPLVTFVVAVIGTAALALLHRVGCASRGPDPRHRTQLLIVGVAVAIGLLPLVAIPIPVEGAPATVGYVQGNVPKAGLDFNAERRAVLDNHVSGTETLAATLPTDISLVVWPENSSDIDPLRNADAAAQIQRAVDAVRVPLLVGAVLAEPVGHSSNVSLLYRPGGGEPERYTKLHPVPFAEFIPYREFFARITPTADLAGNFVAGDTIGAFEIPTDQGSYWALPTICFEVAYDGLMRDSVLNPGAGGPQLLVVQTNNATFGWSAESEQQFAISRLRAIEHGRSVVHVSTVGVSGFIAPDGTVTHKSGLFEPAQAWASVPVRAERTLSDRLGPWPERLLVGAFGLLLVAAWGAMGARTVRRGD